MYAIVSVNRWEKVKITSSDLIFEALPPVECDPTFINRDSPVLIFYTPPPSDLETPSKVLRRKNLIFR